MASFSQSPVPPRRSARNRQPVSPPPRRAQRLANQPTATRITPNRLQRNGYGDASPASGMDVDGDVSMSIDHAGPSEMTYAKTDELAVSFYANLPVEVKQVLRNAGM